MAVGLAFVALSGLAQDSGIDFPRVDQQLANYGSVDWSARWDRNVISVCWLDHPEFAQERRWVRDAVAKTWEANSGARLVGWRNCGSAGADVKITVDDSNPRSYIGRHVLGHSPSMWLNFTFKAWSAACARDSERCIRAIAAHEFGHVLGFQHEQLRSDAPQACRDHLKARGEWEQVDTTPTALTPYDPDSIMNYCNAFWNNNGALSANDITAVQILFPKA